MGGINKKMEEEMKTKQGLTKRAAAVVTCASLMLLTVGAWTAFAAGASLQENEAVWGAPVGIQKLDNVTEKRFYKPTNTMDIGLRTFVYKEGRVIEDGFARVAPDTANKDNKGLPVSDLSVAYYQSNPATAEEKDKLWGSPVAVRTLADGSEERYYKFQNSLDAGFRYFKVKDGKVVASGIARVIGTQEQKAELKGVQVAGTSGNAGSVPEIEKVWGKPLQVKALANGTEERYYKYENSINVGGNRMFLFKDGQAVATGIANF